MDYSQDRKRLYPDNDFIFQQDDTTSHTRHQTEQYLEDAAPEG